MALSWEAAYLVFLSLKLLFLPLNKFKLISFFTLLRISSFSALYSLFCLSSPMVFYAHLGLPKPSGHSWMKCPQINVYSELHHVTLSEKRAFAHVIRLRWGHTGLRWALNPMAGVLARWGEDIQSNTQKNNTWWWEIGATQPQAPECQGWLEASRS